MGASKINPIMTIPITSSSMGGKCPKGSIAVYFQKVEPKSITIIRGRLSLLFFLSMKQLDDFRVGVPSRPFQRRLPRSGARIRRRAVSQEPACRLDAAIFRRAMKRSGLLVLVLRGQRGMKAVQDLQYLDAVVHYGEE